MNEHTNSWYQFDLSYSLENNVYVALSSSAIWNRWKCSIDCLEDTIYLWFFFQWMIVTFPVRSLHEFRSKKVNIYVFYHWTRSWIFHACIFLAINYYCLTSFNILSFLTAFIYFCQIDDVLPQGKSNLGTNRTLRHEVTCHFLCSVSDRLSWMKTAWNQNYRFLAFSWRTSFMRSYKFLYRSL